jgi:Flp pilus assembly protein TadG
MRTADQRGSLTIWMLGLCVAVLFLGGIGLDLWRVIEARRSLSVTADAAATAGANGLDETALRRGDTTLDRRRAEQLAADQLARSGDASRVESATVVATAESVRVDVVGEVRLSLLGIFVLGEPVEVHAHAEARPRREA